MVARALPDPKNMLGGCGGVDGGTEHLRTEQPSGPCSSKGTWCSGITPAQHAGGPGFNPQRVHVARRYQRGCDKN